MRRLLPLVALMLAGGLLLGPTLAGAQGDGSENLVVLSKTLRIRHVDHAPSGETPGDVFLFKYAFWDESGTNRLGTAWVECTLDFGTVAICTAAVRIDGRGWITGTGGISNLSAPQFTFPVTGGTGDFRDVTGEVRAAAVDEETIIFEFRLGGVRP